MVWIDAEYKHLIACAAPDDSRPVLAGIWIERLSATEGRAWAANGFMLACVPCELEPDDVAPCIIRPEAWKQAMLAKTPKGLRRGLYLQLTAKGARVVYAIGTPTIPYIEGQYPRVHMVVPTYPADQTNWPVPPLNYAYVTAAGRACGSQYSNMLRFQAGPPKNGTPPPVLLHTQKPGADGRPIAPFAVVMPMQADWPPVPTAPATPAETCSACEQYERERDVAESEVRQLETETARLREVLDAHHAPGGHPDCRQCAQQRVAVKHAERQQTAPLAGPAAPVSEYHAYVAAILTPAKRAYAVDILAARDAGQPDPVVPAGVDAHAAERIRRRLRGYQPLTADQNATVDAMLATVAPERELGPIAGGSGDEPAPPASAPELLAACQATVTLLDSAAMRELVADHCNDPCAVWTLLGQLHTAIAHATV